MAKKICKVLLGVCIMALVFGVWASVSPVTMVWFIVGAVAGIAAGIRLEGNVFPKIRMVWSVFQRILSESGQPETPGTVEPQTVTSCQENSQSVENTVKKEEHVPASDTVMVSEQGEPPAECEKGSSEHVRGERLEEGLPQQEEPLPNVEVRPEDIIPDDPEIPASFNIYACCLPEEPADDIEEEKPVEMEFNALSSVPPDILPKDTPKTVKKSKEAYTSLDDMLKVVS